jgi:hypothetical protein
MATDEEFKSGRFPTLSQDVVVKFKLHFLLTIIGTVIGIVIVFVNLRNDVVQLLQTVSHQQVLLESNQAKNNQLENHLSIVEAKLDYIKEVLQK